MGSDQPAPRRGHRFLKGLAALALASGLAVAALFAALWLEHRSAVTLPQPSGPFAVGRTIYDWVDDGAIDTLAPTAGVKRELLVWIWYPAESSQSAAMDDYMPRALQIALRRQLGPLNFVAHDLSKVRSHSIRNAAISPARASYPVVIMRAGASLEIVSYSTIAEDLASHGYVVVGFDAPYRTGVVAFPDGRVATRLPQNNPELCVEKAEPEQSACVNRVLDAWTADIGFVLDRLLQLNGSQPSSNFSTRLDLTRVGAFGHSFGGAQAAQFCSQDSRCKAGIDIDGSLHGSVIQSGIHVPFMFLLSGYGDFSSDAEVRQIESDIQSVYERLPASGRLRVIVKGANHFTFSDDGALLKSRVFRLALRAFGKLRMGGRRQLVVTSYCVRSFFDIYLKGESTPPSSFPSPAYPEIRVVP